MNYSSKYDAFLKYGPQRKHHLPILVAKQQPQNRPQRKGSILYRCRCQVIDPERTPKKTPPLHSNSNIYRRCRCPQNGPQRKPPRCIATAHRRLATCTQLRKQTQPDSLLYIQIFIKLRKSS
jgi:hypothetical protein